MDKNALFDQKLPTRQVEIPGVGLVTVRGLSRAEAMMVSDAKSLLERDRRMLSAGVIDPDLTYQDVERWQKSAPAGQLEDVSMAIAELSGMLPSAEKEAVARFPGESES